MSKRARNTEFLNASAEGTPAAVERLLPLIYDELRDLAERYLRSERRGHTLQPTALVHEAFLRLIGKDGQEWENQAQFFTVAAQTMRHILIDHARRKQAAKRGGRQQRVSLEDLSEKGISREAYLVALDDELADLTEVDPQMSRVVELRFFAGFGVDEAAKVLGVSPIKVKRMWKMAKGWLHREISRGA